MLSLSSGAWSIATIEIVQRAGNGTQANESYSSHDKEKEQCFLLFVTLVV